MATGVDRRKWFVFKLVEIYYAYDPAISGWWFALHTPLFGVTAQRKYSNYPTVGYATGLTFGLLMKVWTFEGDFMYRWHWNWLQPVKQVHA
jgi:hypothetical protein